MYHILLCDDDPDIVRALKIYLTDPNYTIHEAYSGRQALHVIAQTEIHLVLMDIMMPEMDGISAMAAIRERSNVPIILITAKSEESDIILGLNVGADDYITKPFHPAEVTARVRSALRRYLQLGGGEVKPQTLSLHGIALDDSAKTVTRDGTPVALTPTEYEILKLLLSSPGRVFSPTQIYREIWRQSPATTDNTVAVHIRHLREKLEIDPAAPRFLKAVWGHGYMIEAEKR